MALDEVWRMALGATRAPRRSQAVAKRQFDSVATAAKAFAERAGRLLDVNQWSRLSGVEYAQFALYDEAGRRAYRPVARPGDFVAIALPFAGLARTDWVRIERIERGPNRVTLVVRPSHDPTRRPPSPHLTAHFFTRAALNVFSLERRGPWLIARVEGQDELANTGEECESPSSALLNRLVAEGGWQSGPLGAGSPQQRQWERFTRRLIA